MLSRALMVRWSGVVDLVSQEDIVAVLSCQVVGCHRHRSSRNIICVPKRAGLKHEDPLDIRLALFVMKCFLQARVWISLFHGVSRILVS